MYDMYSYPDAITQRASEAELSHWRNQGVEDQEPSDYVAARQVSVAERFSHHESLMPQVAATLLLSNTVEAQ